MPKAYSYLRFSTPDQLRGDSYRRQSQLAVDYANKHRLALDTDLTFEDLGVSAFRSKNAKKGALRLFLDAVEDGEIEQGAFLLVESLDRISRADVLTAVGVFTQIINAGVTLVLVANGKAFSKESIIANPIDLLMAVLEMIRANEESLTKSRRLIAAWSNKRAHASERPLTRKCPGWLRLSADRKTFEVIPERVAIVERIFREAANGRGQHAITQGLNKDSVPTFGGGRQWHRGSVVAILRNPAVVGTYIPGRVDHSSGFKRRTPQEPVTNYFPAVIDADTFDKVRAIAGDSTTHARVGATKTIANILAGLARCPKCGDPMTKVGKKGKGESVQRTYLLCTNAKASAGCEYHSVRLHHVEQALIGYARDIETSANSPMMTANDELNALLRESAQAEDAIERLAEEMEGLLTAAAHQGKKTGAILAQRIAETEERLIDARKRHADLDAEANALTPLRIKMRTTQFIEAATAEPFDRAAMNVALRTLLSSVIIDYDAFVLKLVWKSGVESMPPYATKRVQVTLAEDGTATSVTAPI